MLVKPSSRARWMFAAIALPLALVAVTAPVQSSAAPPAQSAAQPPDYKRVVMVVLDQLRPEFIDAFDMDNVKALMAAGTSFDNAYLGHMGSETVVSHNVMTSGMLPKHMGWADEWLRDTDGVLGPVNERYVTGSMSKEQFDALILDKGYPKLADYLHAAYPGKTVATIGEKNYATYSMGGPGSDIRITFSGRSFDLTATRRRTSPGVDRPAMCRPTSPRPSATASTSTLTVRSTTTR
jgi:hypothetical protein